MPTQPVDTDIPLDQLVSIALEQLAQRGFAAKSIKYYRIVWDRFLVFAASSSPTPTLVSQIDSRYLRHQGIKPGVKRSKLSWSQDVTRRGLRILREVQETGWFKSHDRSTCGSSIPTHFQELQCRYEVFCQKRLAHRCSTIAGHRHVLKHFYLFLAEQKINSFHNFKHTLLNEYIVLRSERLNSNSLAAEVGCIRSILRFLCMEGIVDPQVLLHARTLRFPNEHRLPQIWSADTVELLLSSVNRSSKVGKRDFAILLLASRLGLRASDIRSLKIENIQWDQNQISLRQCKTDRPLSLPLSEEVGEAIIDYLYHARPTSEHREVFLKVRAPHDPVCGNNTFYSVIETAIKRSNITVPAGKTKGLHSLRHTLATQLVTDSHPLESVAAVLGHSSVESTRLYTHLDYDTLSCVAIDPEQVLS